MKKFLCVLLCVLMLVSGTPVYAADDVKPVVTAATVQGPIHRGEKVSVPVSISNVTAATFVIEYSYDESKLEFIPLYDFDTMEVINEDGSFGDPSFPGDEWLVGPKAAVWVNSKNFTRSGTMFTLVFRVKEDCPNGFVPVSVTDVDIVNFAEQTIACDVVNGGVKVDCDGHVFGEWQHTVLPTTTAPGLDTRTCTKPYCGASETRTTYLLSFDARGGSVEAGKESLIVVNGEPYGTFPMPTRTGYTFTGWYAAPDGNDRVLGTDIANITGPSMTVYAHWEGKSDSVTFDAGEGTVTPTSKSVTFGSAYGELPTATRTGYDFVGWFTALEGGEQVTKDTVVSIEGAHTLFAHWRAKQYTVTFSFTGAECDTSSKVVTYDAPYGTLPTPTREGYDFAGWYTAFEGGEQVISTTVVKITADQTLYARWTGKTYTVTFNAVEGSCDVESMRFANDAQYDNLPVATREGYTFDGWMTAEGAMIKNGDVVALVKDITLYAKYTANQYNVSFNGNGGVSTAPAKKVTFDAAYGELPDAKNVSRTGYDFTGWASAASGGTAVTSSTIVKTASDHELFAQWKAKTYTVSFDSTGGSAASPVDVTYGENYGTLPTPTRTGYNFAGWFLGEDQITAETVVDITENVTLEAHWTAKTFKLIFSVGEGETCPVAEKEIVFNTAYGELPTASKTGYSFTGWKLADGTVVTAATVCSAEGDVTVYPMWSINSYELVFNANGGECAEPERSVEFNAAYGELPEATREGYDFAGWYTASVGGTEVTAATVMGAADVTVYAHWTAKTFTVTLDPNEGTCEKQSITVTYDSTYSELPEATRPGFTFGGWYTAAVGGTQVKNGDTVKITADTTLFAHWLGAEYKVTLDPAGGTVDPAEITVRYNASYGTLPVPVKPGYDFVKWIDENGNEITAETSVTLAKDHTLTAVWQAKVLTVTLNANGGECEVPSVNATYDSVYPALPTPTREGYSFVGWFNAEDAEVKAGDKVEITENATLTAKWQANSYTVSFDAAGGEAVDPIEVTFDAAYGTLPVTFREGYTFAGWFLGENEIKADSIVKTADAHSLTAHWQANKYTVSFDAAGGEAVDPIEVTFDAAYGTLPVTFRTGYTFAGWFLGENEIKADSIVKTADAHSLTAHWQANTYKVTFAVDAGNGESCDTAEMIVTYDQPYGELPVAVKEGFAFGGWLTESGTLITAETIVKLEEDITLHASFSMVIILVTKNTYANGTEDETLAKGTVTLEASYFPEDLSEAPIVWELKAGDEDYAKLSNKGVLTALDVTERVTVTVIAKAEDNDALRGEKAITIIPTPAAIEIVDAEGKKVDSLTLDLGADENAWTGSAIVLPDGALGASQEYTVKYSSEKLLEAEHNEGDAGFTLKPLAKGKATVTFTAKDNSKASFKLTVNIVDLCQNVEPRFADGSVADYVELTSGSSVALTAWDTDTETKLANSAVVWDAHNDPYVTVANGKISTKEVVGVYETYVTVTVKDNNAIEPVEIPVVVLPKAQMVAIESSGIDITNEAIELPVGTVIELDNVISAVVYPIEADQEITWKSSSAKIASIEGNLLTVLSAGKFTLTATSVVGKKSAKLNFVAYVPMEGEVSFYDTKLDPNEFELTASSYTYKIVDADGKALNNADFAWFVFEPLNYVEGVPVALEQCVDTAYATIANGKLSIKNLCADKIFCVFAISKLANAEYEVIELVSVVKAKAKEGTLSIWETVYEAETPLFCNDLTKQVFENMSASDEEFCLNAAIDGEFLPNDGSVVWSSSNVKAVTVDAVTGVMKIVGAGNATITAKYNGKSATFQVKSVMPVQTITLTAPAEEIASGKSIKVTAKVVQPAKPTNSKLNYLVTDEDPSEVLKEIGFVNGCTALSADEIELLFAQSKFATCKNGTVAAAKNLTEPHTVYVIAYSADGYAFSEPVVITLCPITVALAMVLENDLGFEYVTGITRAYDITDFENGLELRLGVATNPVEASHSVTWTSSNKKSLEVDANGVVTLGEAPKAGAVTITAKANDGSGKSATFKINLTKLVEEIEITGANKVGGGKSITLKANVLDANAGNKKVTWEIVGGNKAYATISTSGVLKAKAVTAVTTVTVVAKATDGSGVVSEPYTVTITPVATLVNIFLNGNKVTGQTVSVDMTDLAANLSNYRLSAFASPLAGSQEFEWSSSAPAVIGVDAATGALTVGALKATTVTITAKATDGSGKSATVKLKLVNAMNVVKIDAPNGLDVEYGKTIKLVAIGQVNPKPTSTAVVWSIVSGEEYATVTSKGIVKGTNTTDEPHAVVIKAAPADGIGEACTVIITSNPKK